MQSKTHLGIDPRLCGHVVELQPGRSKVRLDTNERMTADAHGLVHGGFVFGLADYAAMLAVNDPNVVLGAASSRFLKPVRGGESVVATATLSARAGRRHEVDVVCARGDDVVMRGTFTCFVLDRHVFG